MFYNSCQTHGTRIKQIFLVLLSLHREEVFVLAGEDGSAERAERAGALQANAIAGPGYVGFQQGSDAGVRGGEGW